MSEELEQFKNKCSKLVEDEKYIELLTICETKLEELNKTAPDDKEFLACIYFAIGYAKEIGLENYDNAIEYYNKAIELKPDYVYAYNNRGNAKYSLGKFQDAIEDYNKVIELMPDNEVAYNNRGNAKDNLGKYQDAIEDYNKAIELMPDYAAYYNRGHAKDNLGNFQDAIEDYNKAIELNPNYEVIYNDRGVAKAKLGNFQDAIEDYDKAIELMPDYAGAYYNKGLVKAKLSKFQEAVEDYNKAIELKPDYEYAYLNRGVAKANLDNFQEAIEDYNKAIELMPDCAIVYLLRGATNLDLHNYIKAIKDFWLFLIVKIGFKRQHKHQRIHFLHLHFPWISHEASLRAKRSNPGNKIADKPLVFRDDMLQAGCTKSCHRALVARSMDCFAAQLLAMTYGVILPKIRFRNDAKCHTEGKTVILRGEYPEESLV